MVDKNHKVVDNILMLSGLFGNETAEKALLSLFHYGDSYVAAIAKDFGIAANPVRGQLERLERTGIIHSKLMGRTRVYSFNPKNPYTAPVKEVIRILYEAIPPREREGIFRARQRPRRKGKPVR